MTSKRKRNGNITTSNADQSSTENIEAALRSGGQGDTASNQNQPAPHKKDDDIKAEITRRREQLAKEEHDLKVSLIKARIERAVLTQTRTIIDARIRDLQKQV